MKSLSFIAFTATFAASISGAIAQACADPRTATPLYRAYSQSATDHFYTANSNEHANAVNNLGYSEEGITGYVFSTQGAYTTALYRMYNPNIQDHFYTTSASERSNAITNLGYSDSMKASLDTFTLTATVEGFLFGGSIVAPRPTTSIPCQLLNATAQATVLDMRRKEMRDTFFLTNVQYGQYKIGIWSKGIFGYVLYAYHCM